MRSGRDLTSYCSPQGLQGAQQEVEFAGVGIRRDSRCVESGMDIDGLFFRAEALTLGFTDSSLRRARLSGELIAVRPGAYVTARYFHSLDSPQQHLLLARAMSDGTVLSHVSAAIAWGMDVWGLPLARVHLTTGRPITTRTTRRRTVHGTRLAPADFTTHDGLTLTTPARTVVDIARTATHTQAVCTGDSALRRGLVTAKALSEAVAAAKYRTGTPGAVRAVEAMTNRSDSVGESRSRLILQDQNLPVPLLNQSVFDADGTFLGRVDFLFAELGVIGEFDGSGKYGESGAAVRKNLVAEKYREDRFRDAGWIVVRWGWADLADPSALQDRVRRALARGARAPQPDGFFRGDPLPQGTPHRSRI